MPAPVAKAEMLIRRPAADVFVAFSDPTITSMFWFTKGSAPLEVGKKVRWDWEMYGFSIDVEATVIEDDRRIVIEWPAPGGPTTVEWVFKPRPDRTTFVTVTNTGFRGSDEEIAQQVVGATEGFAFVLAGAKAFLEQGVFLDLVSDRFPDGLPAH
jgi:uncharacterized protein YndB with AHSA1/START domain